MGKGAFGALIEPIQYSGYTKWMTSKPVLFPAPGDLTEGSLVGYNLKKGPAIGIVTRKGTGTIHLFIKTQKEFSVKSRAIFVGTENYRELDRPGWVRVLQDYEFRVGELCSQVDLEFLHECVLEGGEEKEYSFEDLLSLYYGEKYDFSEIISLAQTLAVDRCYFRRKKESYLASSSPEVENYKKEERNREEARKREEFLVSFLKTPHEPGQTGGDLTEEAQEALRDLAIHYEKSSRFQGWIRIFQSAGIKARADLRRVLTAKGILRSDELFELMEAHYPLEFNSSFMDYLKSWEPGTNPGPCQDLRHLRTFTVDNEETMDRDDALSYDPKTGSFFVHIINVARIVDGDSRIEKELQKRLTSLYLPDGHFSMFPKHLVTDLLSLDEGTDRHVLSVRFWREQGSLRFEIFPSLVTIDENLAYSQFLGSQREIRIFYEEAERLREERFERGAIEYKYRDVDIFLEEGHVRIFERPSYPAQKVISEFSILANSLFARYAREMEIPILFRTQKGDVEAVQNHPLFNSEISEFYTYHRLRPLWGKTRWDVQECSHFHLGVPHYTQMSSPIRRYIDYVNQKQVWNHLCSLPILNREQMVQAQFEIQSHLFEVGAIQSRRNFYYLLRFMKQERDFSCADFETPVTVLDVGEDWVSFHLDQYEKVLKFKQDPKGLEPGMQVKVLIRDVDVEAREARGIVVKEERSQESGCGN